MLMWIVSLSLLVAQAAYADIHPDFVVKDGPLRNKVEFWKKIYTEYTTRQSVVHDARDITIVYEVASMQGTSSKKLRLKWKQILVGLHKKVMAGRDLEQELKDGKLTEQERAAVSALSNIDEKDKYLQAAHRRRLRVQLGQSNQFLQGYVRSGKYIGEMERIFKSRGLPTELTRLPFVESSFNTRARSKVGASGIWQFMRSTGRVFLKINDHIDERNDPLFATHAAAELLKINYEALGNWPLAVTAYNHGRQGMMRATRRVGSDLLEDVMEGYKSRRFGFASSNFFACLVAAIEIVDEPLKYFGKSIEEIERERPIPTVEVALPEPIDLSSLARYKLIDLSDFKEDNLSFLEGPLSGKVKLPKGTRIRLRLEDRKRAEETKRVFLAGFKEIPKLYRKRN